MKLYEEWSKFTLENAGTLSGIEIDIQPKTINTGAQYLLFHAPYKAESKVYCAYPDKELSIEKKLSDQIVDLMKFFTGRTFLYEKESARNGDWTKLIWNLIELSGVSVYNRRGIKRVDEKRSITRGTLSLFDEMNRKIDISEKVIGEAAVPCIIVYAKEAREEFLQYEQLCLE